MHRNLQQSLKGGIHRRNLTAVRLLKKKIKVKHTAKDDQIGQRDVWRCVGDKLR